MTFNKRITEGIQDGTIKSRTVDGVTFYQVEPPRDGEEVVGYNSFSAFSHDPTLTEIAEVKYEVPED